MNKSMGIFNNPYEQKSIDSYFKAEIFNEIQIINLRSSSIGIEATSRK